MCGLKEAVRSNELAPVWGKAGEFRVTVVEEHRELLRRERMERSSVRLRPPAQLPLREPAEEQPVTGTVIDQHLQCRAASVAKDERVRPRAGPARGALCRRQLKCQCPS